MPKSNCAKLCQKMLAKSANTWHYSLSRQNSVKICKDFTRDRIFYTNIVCKVVRFCPIPKFQNALNPQSLYPQSPNFPIPYSHDSPAPQSHNPAIPKSLRLIHNPPILITHLRPLMPLNTCPHKAGHASTTRWISQFWPTFVMLVDAFTNTYLGSRKGKIGQILAKTA